MFTIALIGTRGVPANYGGFETCVHEVGRRLAERGHEVTVYCRSGYYEDRSPEYLGMRRVFLPNVKKKSLDTMSHTFLSAWHAAFQKFDVCLVFNAANSPFLLPLRVFGNRIAVNTDGLEWKRSKWGLGGRTYYKLAERISCMMANRLVSDSPGMRRYYAQTYGMASTEIAYGAYLHECASTDRLKELGLEPGEFFLQITRFEPENHPLLTARAFKQVKTEKKLVLVGGNPYKGDYTLAIEGEASDSVILPGFIYDQELLKQLWCSCHAYIHGNSVGGTNPALLQTMASGCFTIAVDIDFNRDLLGDGGIYFQPDEASLAKAMQWAEDHPDELADYKCRAVETIRTSFNWDVIADEYERLCFDLMSGKYPWSALDALKQILPWRKGC